MVKFCFHQIYFDLLVENLQSNYKHQSTWMKFDWFSVISDRWYSYSFSDNTCSYFALCTGGINEHHKYLCRFVFFKFINLSVMSLIFLGILYSSRRTDTGWDQGTPRRARDGVRQQATWTVHIDRHSSCATRCPSDRGHIRHRR